LSIPLYIYRGTFVNTETTRPGNENIQKTFFIDIEDHETLVDDGSEQILIGLDMADAPVRVIVIDNDEESFTPIRSTQLEINFYTGSGVNIASFAEGADDRFKVHFYESDGIGQTTHFRGILSTADNRQEFMPDPNLLTLVATDGLGLLNDIPLTDFDDNTPQNEHRVMDFIAYALSKTGHSLNINVVMNIRHEDADTLNADSTGDGHFYKYCWLDARSFEDEIGTCEDCYTVLEKLFTDSVKLFQHEGEWWIIRVDEIEYGHNYFVFSFDDEGIFLSKTEITRELTVGVGLPHAFMNDDAEISLERLYKEIVETFRYERWKETICNIDISRGNIADPVGTTEGEEIEGEPECIDYYSEGVSGFFTDLDQPPVSGAEGLLKVSYDFGIEYERKLVGTAVARRHYFKMQPFPVAQGDKLTFGLDTRTDTDLGITNVFPAHILLIANDGTYYVWDYDQPSDSNQWVSVVPASGWFLNNWSYDRSGEDTTEWKNISATSHPVPKAGKVYVRLVVASAGIELWFQNITLEIQSLIGGSYRTITGHEHKVKQDVSTRNVRENQVYMNDGPSAAYKGVLLRPTQGTLVQTDSLQFSGSSFSVAGDQTALYTAGEYIYIDTVTPANDGLFRVTAVTYHIIGDTTQVTVDGSFTTVTETGSVYRASFEVANRFYAGHVYPDGPVGDSVRTFGRMQAFDVWNQFNRVMTRIEGTVDGTATMPSLIYKYFSGDATQMTVDRIFQLLHYEIDIHLCEWEAYFAEVVKSDVGKIYEGHSFKYLTE
jgi:hypothetical protein